MLPGRELCGKQIEVRNLVPSRSRHRIGHLEDFQRRIADNVLPNESHIEGRIVWRADFRSCSLGNASPILERACVLSKSFSTA
jgi:hypothetical protein